MEYKRREFGVRAGRGPIVACGNCGKMPHKGRSCDIDDAIKTDNTQTLVSALGRIKELEQSNRDHAKQVDLYGETVTKNIQRIKELEAKCKRHEKALRKTKKIIEMLNSEASSLPYSWQIINEALEEE